jgi:indolepyruvate ferredoxin oxidoreductase alpha subunit
MSGNQAIARGAYEYGVKFASAYPGTPSTEILENMPQYKDQVYSEWSSNEKTAFEAGIGASFAGARTMVTMKHVGLNVAADPLMTLTYSGIKGGFVVVVADDPAMHSSQNEQDTRHYGRFAKIPVLEPSDSQEAKDMVGDALEISEAFDTPVILRSNTRISHGESVVILKERKEGPRPLHFEKDNLKYVMIPAYARKRHTIVEERLKKLADFAENSPLNKEEINSDEIGIITSGTAYQFCKENFPDASYLKLGMVWPLPAEKIKNFAKKVKKLYVIEELDRFLEENIRLMGVEVLAKPDKFVEGELDADTVREIITGEKTEAKVDTSVPPRPPVMCAGCPHRSVFTITNKLGLIVDGDIGCYTLGTLPPLDALHTTICMGASIGMMHGMRKVLPPEEAKKVVSVIGDSTFFHTGINNLIGTLYNKGTGTILILDNRITAMTGGQHNPGTGRTLMNEVTDEIDIPSLCRGLGVKDVKVVDNYDMEALEKALRDSVERDELSVVITKRPCVLIIKPETPYEVVEEKCTACGACLRTGCPALIKQEDGKVVIDRFLCNGCSVCDQVCPFDAIVLEEEK